MKTTNKFLAALLIVFGAATMSAKAKSGDVGIYCKVMNIENTKKFEVIFSGRSDVDVKIRIVDEFQKEVFSEIVPVKGKIARVYELGELPDGVYTFRIKAGDYKYEYDALLESWKGDNLNLLPRIGQKVALIGKNDSGSNINVLIQDEQGHTVYREIHENNSYINKLYDLSSMDSAEATVLVYADNELVKSQVVK